MSDLRERLEALVREYETEIHAQPLNRGSVATLREVLAKPHLLMGEPVAVAEYDNEGNVVGVTRKPDGYWKTRPLYAPKVKP